MSQARNDIFIPAIENALAKENLADFDALWNIARDWIEPHNERRNGWSGVSRLQLSDQSLPTLFMKRQENHNTRTLAHPIDGVPTYLRELKSIQLFNKHGIPTLTPVYYGERVEDGKHQAILISLALDGFQDMFELNREGDEQRTQSALRELGKVTWKMHDKGIAHYCLYPNHVFVRFNDDQPEVCLIDLEKVRREPFGNHRRLKDLDCYLRHSKEFSEESRQCFVDAYMSIGHVPGEAKLRQQLEKRIRIL